VAACGKLRQSLTRRSAVKATVCVWDYRKNVDSGVLSLCRMQASAVRITSLRIHKKKFATGFGRGTGVSAIGWGTALQAGRSRNRFLMVSLEFFIYIILLASLWSRYISWRVQAVSALGWQPYHLRVPESFNLLDLSRPVQRLLYLTNCGVLRLRYAPLSTIVK